MVSTWTGNGGRGGDAETVTSDDAPQDGALCALYVTGPSGGTRHLLLGGIVRLGRAPECTILVNDPRVSRVHAALHIDGGVAVSDLGSANGTFVGDERLEPGAVRSLSLGQSFFLGDSALVVRTTSLRRSCSRRVSSLADVERRLLERDASAAAFGLCKVRARTAQGPLLEAVLGELLDSQEDWLVHAGSDQLVLGVGVQAREQLLRFERRALQELSSWGILVDVQSRLVDGDGERTTRALRELLSGESEVRLRDGQVVMREPSMELLRQTVARAAAGPVSVLIQGETGVGKDVIACMLHELSPRAERPLVRLNCASLPEALLESELFGYERGAFTGANAAKPGLFEVAEGGSVFLDEIGDLPLPLQAKLLRVVESREVIRLGGVRARPIDVRFVAATNRDLSQLIAEGGFRQDLYYRLNCVSVTVPPLRERPSEVVPLARLFLDGAGERFGRGVLSFSADALSALARYAWPGNVRELRNVVERAALLSSGSTIDARQLGLPCEPAPAAASPASQRAPAQSGEFAKIAQLGERARIERALNVCAGNQSRAAELLGIPRRTLVRRIAVLGLPRPRRSAG